MSHHFPLKAEVCEHAQLTVNAFVHVTSLRISCESGKTKSKICTTQKFGAIIFFPGAAAVDFVLSASPPGARSRLYTTGGSSRRRIQRQISPIRLISF